MPDVVVPGGLAPADDAAEKVFDAQGQEHLPVRLHLWKVDDNIPS